MITATGFETNVYPLLVSNVIPRTKTSNVDAGLKKKKNRACKYWTLRDQKLIM